MISNKYKIPGVGLIIVGIALTIVYFVHRIDISVPVFAVYSSYLATSFFKIIHTNIFEELILISFLGGFMLTAFSKEKKESVGYTRLRCEAWQKAMVYNAALLAFCILFVYGAGFMGMLILNLFSVFIFYLVIFYVTKSRFDRQLMNSSGE